MAALLTYPQGISLDETHFPAWIKFDIYKRKSPKDSTPLQTINLFMPESLNNPNTVSWDTERLGFIGGKMVNQKDGMSLGTLMGGAWDTVKLFGSNMASGAASSMAQYCGGRATADQLRGALQGQVRNPYLTMLFRGVDFRTFAMDFTFYPHVESDCDLIDNIIREFRAHSLPPGAAADQPSFLGYPNEVEIAYMWRGKENRYMHKFKRCVITGIDVNYTGAGMMSVMRNGFPSHIKMHLKFSEIDLVLAEDVRKGY